MLASIRQNRNGIRFDAVVSPTMWGTVLVFALLAAVDPVRIGIAVLLIFALAALLDLLVFWLGNMATNGISTH